jgi:uncharacterized protein (PEP-CTERM system associated)
LHTDWTREFGTSLHYQNVVSIYENSGGTANNPSYAGLLNRVEQSIGLDLEWVATPTTTWLVGYMYGLVLFTGNEPIAQNTNPPYSAANPNVYYSGSRNSQSQYGYVGVQHTFLENLTGKADLGVQYTDYYNDPSSTSSLGPYGDASLVYTYDPGSYAQVGVTESRNATDQVQVNSQGQITQDQLSTVVYGSINHALTPKLTGSLVGHFQYSIYNEGQVNNSAAEFYNFAANLSYAFNRHFSSDLGYSFDWYTTPVAGQDYTRNRIYLGVTATY